ncbi:hypothetical protein Pla175_01110 [Pirellulimonas nuda]|uniref:Holliday junction resolvase n=1 Tax=Pirellulimonas nuda TaxID=2528009 RepID=A0A518D5L2_9BACT|nr:HYExAFE family protein [Pirellulimonas nuda]QDU86761.1 hypothetical protein Pla175_01110 [Pirellulimonas nuda]
MANRSNHYEAAFEAYLRAERLAYVATSEQRRALAEVGSLKSVDFVVSPAGGPTWLVDVKGRRFPSGQAHRSYWKNWATAEDLRSLADWRARFGPDAEAALVFAYHLVADRSPLAADEVFWHRDRPYAFVAVSLADYQPAARPLSARWGTVHAPVAEFRRCARPARLLLGGRQTAALAAAGALNYAEGDHG